MNRNDPQRTGLIQHKVRPEVKAWIKSLADKQERSQGWMANKLLEDAFARAQTQEQRS